MFKLAWWRYWDQCPARFDDITLSWDLSFKGGEGHDYVVGLALGRLAQWSTCKARASLTETCCAIEQMVAKTWPQQ